MTDRAVHWHEGAFLHPHHFQAERRSVAKQGYTTLRWSQPHAYGVRTLELDDEAMRNSRLVIRKLEAILRDGTTIRVPADLSLQVIDLKAAFKPGQPLEVLLALPTLNLGRANASNTGSDGPPTRYLVEYQEFEDENTGVNPQPVAVRIPNVRLLLGDQDTTGFETLPLLRLEKSATPNAAPQLDPTFIPALLDCQAWAYLRNDLLHATYDRMGRKRRRLAELLAERGTTIGTTDPNDAISLAHLQELNEACAILAVMAFSEGVTPFHAYLELAHMIGQLAIFDRSGRIPEIQPYQHDDLGPRFQQLKIALDRLLDILPEPSYKERGFVGVGSRLQVTLDPDWLQPAWELFIGVRTDKQPDEVLRLLTVPGQLDLKIGSGDRVDQLFQLGQAGLSVDVAPRPAVLPDVPGWSFFRIGRQPEREWQATMRALTLAARINETRLAGSLHGERIVRVRSSNGSILTLQFTLYAVPSEVGG
jgi:type VI secretion system protein ImpJ